jgi:16S rRNA processing protein RimM
MKLIEIGRIVRSQGLKGQIRVVSHLQFPDALESCAGLSVGTGEEDAVYYPLRGVQQAKNALVLKLDGIDDRNAADALRGRSVWMAAESMAPLDEDEYYWSDIIGLSVITENDEPLGRVESVFPTGSNDVYVCRDEGREVLLPAIGQVIKKIDLKNGVMVVSRCPGLIEP